MVIAPQGMGRRETVRLASFNLQPLGEQKLAKPMLAKVLAQTLRRFDLIAVQGIQATAEDILAGLVQLMNEDGASLRLPARAARRAATQHAAIRVYLQYCYHRGRSRFALHGS